MKKKQLQILDTYNLDHNPFVSKCFDTMKKLAGHRNILSDIENPNAPVLERNYIISLVFQMGKDAGATDFGINVFPSGETNKFISDNLNEIKSTYKDLYDKELKPPFEVIPDMVIHSSHCSSASNGDEQYVVIEAKTTKELGKVAFMKDFFKLNVYLCRLNYQNAIYLIVNTSKERIDKLICHYFDNCYFVAKKRLDKILFFIQENKDDTPHAYKLKEDYIVSLK